MRIIFMGSAEGACPALTRLLAPHPDELVAVVTQPDRAKGRSLKVAPCAVGALAAGSRIPVFAPNNPEEGSFITSLSELAPDLLVVVAYGHILTPRVMAIPRLGCINLHFSLLPKYRGAAPVEWAIANGETLTGVTTILMNERMDAGGIILQVPEPIRPEDTAGSLLERLAAIGADVLFRTLNMAREGRMKTTVQNHSQATFAPKLRKEDGRLNWERPAVELHNRVRGFNPRPGCFSELPTGARLRVLTSRIEERPAAYSESGSGRVLDTSGPGPLISTGEQALRLLQVQPEGRKAMSGTSYLCGYPMRVGEQLR